MLSQKINLRPNTKKLYELLYKHRKLIGVIIIISTITVELLSFLGCSVNILLKTTILFTFCMFGYFLFAYIPPNKKEKNKKYEVDSDG